MDVFTVAAGSIRALVGSLAGLGLDVDGVLRDADVTRASLDDPDGRLPETAVLALWLAAEGRWTAAGRDLLGIHAGSTLPLGAFDVLDYVVGLSPTLGDAFRRLVEYQAICSTGLKYGLDEAGTGDIVVVLTHPYALEVLPPGFVEYLWTVIVTRFRGKIAASFAPRIALRHAPHGPRETYRRVLGHVEFGCERTALHVPRDQWGIANPFHETALSAILERHARDVVARVPQARTPLERLRAAIAESLNAGDGGIERTASRLGVSARSLQRQLATEGLSYKLVLDGVRADLARTYLAPTGPSLAEVGYLLGYSDASAFHRAFRRWTGLTPLEYRRGSGAA